MPMTRTDFQRLARTRITDGRLLLRSRQYDGSYYLLGLAVEAALKACIAKKTRKFEFPEKSVVDKSYSHNLAQLVSVAGLSVIIDAEVKANTDFATSWELVLGWSVESRYQKHGAQEVSELYRAITDRRNGLMSCIRRHW